VHTSPKLSKAFLIENYDYGDIFDSYPVFDGIQQTIPSFKEIGKYNPDSRPRQCDPLPILEMNGN